MTKHNKLVRDKIPSIIEANGEKTVTIILDNEEYKKELDKKILEEIKEYLKSDDVEELADVLEVIYAILEYKKLTMNDLENIRKMKKEKRGGFVDCIFLIETIR
ncbi:MAG: nucleoside triphosphate pyrophosphohydrolase [Mollicutes bacterium]|jgi:predicted house-cleaning noncanonical NTP pyrophosphatase (MazG superfamily)|nr:nucleoside triphosphate pyrophosphohydrolase [Mollicutes bacterium]